MSRSDSSRARAKMALDRNHSKINRGTHGEHLNSLNEINFQIFVWRTRDGKTTRNSELKILNFVSIAYWAKNELELVATVTANLSFAISAYESRHWFTQRTQSRKMTCESQKTLVSHWRIFSEVIFSTISTITLPALLLSN